MCGVYMGIYSNNPDYWKRKRSTGSNTERNGDVVVSGFAGTDETLGRIMTSDPYMAKEVKAFIRKALKDARKNLTQDAKNFMKSDPRKAARAVKYAVYKSIFGGNISILRKKAGKAGARYQLMRERKLQPGQKGGNRRPRISDGRNRLETYFGADRGFILRFMNSGTVRRETRYGNRGAIGRRDWFGHTAPWQMESAAGKVADAINEYVNKQTNG